MRECHIVESLDDMLGSDALCGVSRFDTKRVIPLAAIANIQAVRDLCHGCWDEWEKRQ